MFLPKNVRDRNRIFMKNRSNKETFIYNKKQKLNILSYNKEREIGGFKPQRRY